MSTSISSIGQFGETPMMDAWLNFTKSVKVLLVPRKKDRPLDQYLSFRDSVFVIVQDKKFLRALESISSATRMK